MAKIKSLEELKNLKNRVSSLTELRDEGEKRVKILVSMATCGIAAGARPTHLAILDEIEKKGVKDVVVSNCGCMGVCYAEPTVEVQVSGQPPVLYGHVTPERGREIITKHILNGEFLQDIIIEKPF